MDCLFFGTIHEILIRSRGMFVVAVPGSPVTRVAMNESNVLTNTAVNLFSPMELSSSRAMAEQQKHLVEAQLP
jgi:hypothetical protein